MKRRVLGFGSCCYHISSRINEERFYLGEKQKEVLLDLMRRAADFSGIELLTFCIMDNHFHMLVHIPAVTIIGDKELLRRLKSLYSHREYDALVAQYNQCIEQNSEAMRHAFREKYIHRMYNLSEFVSTLKQRFSIWYNKSRDRHGPLWDGRFRSVLVQSSADERGSRALTVMAAYIDLNAVRAKLVNEPQDYPWCGYAQAVCGMGDIKEGLVYILGRGRMMLGARRALREYGRLLHSACCHGEDGVEWDVVLAQAGGKSVMESLLRNRTRSFCCGWIFGDKSFVEFVAHRRPECFPRGRRDLAIRTHEKCRSGLYAALHSWCGDDVTMR